MFSMTGDQISSNYRTSRHKKKQYIGTVCYVLKDESNVHDKESLVDSQKVGHVPATPVTLTSIKQIAISRGKILKKYRAHHFVFN